MKKHTLIGTDELNFLYWWTLREIAMDIEVDSYFLKIKIPKKKISPEIFLIEEGKR